jgi:hypothetical protein
MDPIEQNAQHNHTCKSCGNVFAGRYCNLCGEKVIEAKDRQLKSFVGSVVIATTIVDNKFLKSLWLTISNPGFLSREYVDGKRVNYMRPLQMFFILNLIYFLFPILQMFNSSLYSQLNVLPHARIARQVVAEKIATDGLSETGFQLMYDEKTTSLAKMLIVVFVLIAALPLSIIFARRNRYFTDHLALSVELTSFNIAINAIGLTFLLWLLNLILRWTGGGLERYLNEITLTIIVAMTNLYFIFGAAKTFYLRRGKRHIIGAIAGILGLFLALEAYRFILFFVTVWAL